MKNSYIIGLLLCTLPLCISATTENQDDNTSQDRWREIHQSHFRCSTLIRAKQFFGGAIGFTTGITLTAQFLYYALSCAKYYGHNTNPSWLDLAMRTLIVIGGITGTYYGQKMGTQIALDDELKHSQVLVGMLKLIPAINNASIETP